MRYQPSRPLIAAGSTILAMIIAMTETAAFGQNAPLAAAPAQHGAATPGPLGSGGQILLHNGWALSPAGRCSQVMGDLLLGGVVSPDGNWLAVVNGGAAKHAVHIFSTAAGDQVCTLPATRAQSTGGVAFSPDGARLYVAGGNAGQINVFAIDSRGQLSAEPPLSIPGLVTVFAPKTPPAADAGVDPMNQDQPEEKAYLGGLAVTPDGAGIVVANTAGDSIYSLDSATGAVKARRALDEFDRPGAVAMSKDGKVVYAALWGGHTVLALDTATLRTRRTLFAGSHPNALLLSADGSRLFVSCGNDDSVFVFDTATGDAQEKINMRMTPLAPPGATPSALALSPDQKTLYVANSDNNDVAVADVSVPGEGRVAGLIPTAWYPTIVAASRDGKRIFIGSGKGLGTTRNDQKRPIDPVAPSGSPYIMSLIRGMLYVVDVPTPQELAADTRQVYLNSPYADSVLSVPRGAPANGDNPIPSRPGQRSPIKYVLYIIKENRTYDQILGDLKDGSGKPHGNGDPDLALFGEAVTPNHHAIARQFVTLDNLYASGEVSVDGHHWSNAAYVPDSMQRMWPSEYGGMGGTPIQYGDFGDPLADTPSGRIWDLCERAGLTFRTYYYHVHKRQSDAWWAAKARGERDANLADVYIRDLDIWSKHMSMPRFTVMALSEDHTKGTRPGAFSPRAAVASNDIGVGKIVDACSHSPFWKQMAIFIIEDDAQNGPDHVDAHRTVGLVASPYVRRGAVDSTMYSTCSFLRTMELILGLPPMSQFDAAATPLYAAFTSKPDAAPYTCLPETINITERNTRRSYGARVSMRMDLSEPDHLTVRDEDDLNRVLWHSIRGAAVPYPGAVHSLLFDAFGRPIAAAPSAKGDDDDDDGK